METRTRFEKIYKTAPLPVCRDFFEIALHNKILLQITYSVTRHGTTVIALVSLAKRSSIKKIPTFYGNRMSGHSQKPQ